MIVSPMRSGLLTLLVLALLIQYPVPTRAKNDIFGAITEVNISRFIGSGTAVDLDNDGDLDLVSDDYFIADQDFPLERRDRFLDNTYIAWFENNGRQHYTVHVMG